MLRVPKDGDGRNGSATPSHSPPVMRRSQQTAVIKPALYTSALIYAAFQILFVSFLCSYYNIGSRNVSHWLIDTLEQNEYTSEHLQSVRELMQKTFSSLQYSGGKRRVEEGKFFNPVVEIGKEYSVFTPEQLLLFDGSRDSRPVCLAILGRVYDVDRGKKHYGKGGGYSFFAGRDATRAFVTGDFTPTGLIDDITGLSNEDILAIRDWVSFYEKDYKLVGVVIGRYYDVNGAPTDEINTFLLRAEAAMEWRSARAAEAQVFPPCNSEWNKDSAGRVWCTKKSGGVEREWTGVPRLYSDPATQQKRCACVKNFGGGLSAYAKDKSDNRGDLDHPALQVYPGCREFANSCKIEAD